MTTSQTYNFQVDGPASFNRSVTGLFAACDADPACGAAFPNVLGKWDELIARINAQPVQLPIYNLESGELITYLPINGWPSLSSPCLTNAVAAFIENPAATPDTSCIAQEAPLPFASLELVQARLGQLTADRSWIQRLR